LDPDRILGPRGVPVLEKAFADFKPKGKICRFAIRIFEMSQ
jgi:hypothetical protein